MPNVFGNPNPISKGFGGLGWEVCIMDLVVYGFKPQKLEEGTDVSYIACGKEVRLSVI